MLDVSFDQQMYDIALLLGSRLRKPIDVAMLETVQSEAWRQILFSHLGEPWVPSSERGAEAQSGRMNARPSQGIVPPNTTA